MIMRLGYFSLIALASVDALKCKNSKKCFKNDPSKPLCINGKCKPCADNNHSCFIDGIYAKGCCDKNYCPENIECQYWGWVYEGLDFQPVVKEIAPPSNDSSEDPDFIYNSDNDIYNSSGYPIDDDTYDEIYNDSDDDAKEEIIDENAWKPPAATSLFFQGKNCGAPEVDIVSYVKKEADLKANSHSTFIVGGETSNPHSWPWQVSVRQRRIKSICGGSVLNQNWVLTAAHCKVTASGKYQIVVGDHQYGNEQLQMRTPGVIEEGTEYAIQEVKNHPLYNVVRMRNDDGTEQCEKCLSQIWDFTLVKTKQPMKFGLQVKPVCLPAPNQNFDNLDCVISGWGKVDGKSFEESVYLPSALQEAEVTAFPLDTCKSMWGINNMQEMHVCAGSATASACKGDSGGPLVCKDYSKNQRYWTLVGATSFGSAECPLGETKSSVFGRVSAIIPWILKTVDNIEIEV